MRYTCPSCDRAFDVYSTYYSHKKTHEAPAIPCPTCKISYHRTKAALYRHMVKECSLPVAVTTASQGVSKLESMFAVHKDKW
jgi:hypothetical protein